MNYPSFRIVCLLSLFLLNSVHIVFGQDRKATHSVFLLSNIESLSATAPEFDALQAVLEQEKGKYTILITGDFVDENGFEIALDTKEVAKIDRLLGLAGEHGKVVLVPGDLEWNYSQKKGWKKLVALEKYLKSKTGKKKTMLSKSACLGPSVLKLGKYLKVASVNTQWFVQQDNRSEQEDADCKIFNEREFWDELDDVLNDTDNRNLIVAIHHPALSYGQYAGYKLAQQHFTPPIYGSFKAAHRQNIGSNKDLSNAEFKLFSSKLLDIAKRHPGVIFVSGHENDLQILNKAGNYYINSGGFAISKPVAKGRETIYRQKQPGFAKLIFKKDGAVSVEAFKIENRTKITKSFEQMLFSSPCSEYDNNVPANSLYNPCPAEVDTNENSNSAKFGTTVAGEGYEAGFVKRMFFGKNYRDTWSTPVNNIPFLDLENAMGGLTPYAKGGAAQTISLKFKSEDGQRFSFRSVNKTPTKRLDIDLKRGAYGKIVKDQTSLHHPYGSLIVTTFMDELGLPHSMPKLYLMPDSPKLGAFRKEFAGRYGFLELKPKGKKKDRAGYKGADDVVSTFQMYRQLLNSHDNNIDVNGYVTARILDIWVSDWDRHENNWKWLAYETENGTEFKPFPKDRDKAFYILNGALRVADWDFVAPDMGNFKVDYGKLKSSNFKSKSMDRWLPKSYTREDWQSAAKKFQSLMTDEIIDQAIAALPVEVQPISGPRIKRVLKARRDNLPKAIDKYYLMVAKFFDLVGSNERELFDITRLENGDVRVAMYKLSKDGKKGDQLLNRVFKKDETKEIRLHGLGKRDVFNISGTGASSSILIKIVSGDGVDTIEDNSSVKGRKKLTHVYDKRKKDKVIEYANVKMMKTPEILTFETDKIFAYNYFNMLPSISFNVDDGLSVGAYGNYKIQGFNKPDYKTNMTFNASGTTQGNYNVGMDLALRHIIKKWDMVSGIALISNDRSFRRFYGLGNNTIRDEDLEDVDFYQNSGESAKIYYGFQRDFWQKSSFRSTLRFEHRDINEDPDEGIETTIYDQLPPGSGMDKTVLIGPKFDLELDFTDGGSIPQRGMKLNINNYTFLNSRLDYKVGGLVETVVSTFITRGIKIPTTLALRGGYIHSYGTTPFFYKSYLGQQSNLRGFVRNRFGGDQAAFINSDLRFHFGKVVTSFLPFNYGIFGMFDAGRVWVDGEDSDKIHTAFGGGIYIVPYIANFNLNITFAQPSNDDLLFSFRIGFFLR